MQVKTGDTAQKNGTMIIGKVISVNEFGDVIVNVNHPWNEQGYVQHRFFSGSYDIVKRADEPTTEG